MQQQQATHKPTVKLGSRPYLYHIESDDTPGRFYTTDAYRLTCTCEAGRNGKRCWHLATAIQYDAWRKTQRAKATAQAQMHDLKDAFDALGATPLATTPASARPAGMAALQECFG